MNSNINYKGFVNPSAVRGMEFSTWKPRQYVDRTGPYTIVFFSSGKCRIMGCKTPLNIKLLQYPIINIQVQSVTVTKSLGYTVNLYKISGKFII